NTVEVSRIDLQGVTAKINRTLPDSAFNFDYIISAFVTEQEEPTPTDTTAAMKFNIDRVNLDRIRFVYRDEVIGTSAELDLGHLDTRIETFDLTGSMRFGLPRITITELHGVVRQWAVASSSETPDADDFGIPDTADTNLLPVLELQTIDLSDIDFAYVDETGAMDTRFRVDNLLAKLNRLDLNGEVIDIDEIDIEGSRSSISLGQTQPRVDSLATDVADGTSNWQVTLRTLQIARTNVIFQDANQPRIPHGFDYGNIGITNLEGELTDLFYAADSISGTLHALSAKDHSGFELVKAQAAFVYTDRGAELHNLYL